VSSGREVATAYDAMAETYDALDNQPFYLTQYRTYMEDIAARSAMWRGRVLDLGCGTGIHTMAVAPLADQVVGIDFSPGLVRKARRKLEGLPGAFLMVADATAMPFRHAAFDAAQSYGEPLSHVADPDGVLTELARVMRPGGRVVLSVDNQWNVRTLLHPVRVLRAFRSRGGSVRDWEFYDDAGRPVRLSLKTFTHPELVDLLLRHGFVVDDVVGIHVFTLLAPLPTDARGDDWRARTFRLLHGIDRRLADRYPFNRFGYSKIVSAVLSAEA